MKEAFRGFFTFTSLERKGIVVLIFLVLMISGINLYLSQYSPEVKPADPALFEKEILEFEQQLTIISDSNRHHDDFIPGSPVITGNLFPFDPNDATEVDLLRLGLKNGSARALVNYRKQGGRFYRKEDLKKIYGVSDQLYIRLAPYVNIRPVHVFQVQMAANDPIARDPININRADSSELEMLPGIGPVLARRIVRYRKLLGGFYDTGQLREVYGISDSLYQKIRALVYADTTLIIRLNLNLAAENELAHHPYIGKYAARGIITYRIKVLTIQSFEELVRNGLIETGDLEKLKKYLMI